MQCIGLKSDIFARRNGKVFPWEVKGFRLYVQTRVSLYWIRNVAWKIFFVVDHETKIMN